MVNALCYPFYRFCYYVAILKYTSSILLWYRETDKMSAMNNTTITLEDFFSECYLQYYDIIKRYITFRIDNSYEAEDLVQDAFVRLWEHRAFVNKETVRPLLFTIARNLVTDKVRRYYKKAELLSYIYNVVHTEISADARGTSRPMHEVLYWHYARVKNLEPQWMQYTLMGVNQMRPDWGAQSRDGGGAYDLLGCGTLMYPRD